MAVEAKKDGEKKVTMNSKEFIAKHAKAGTKFKYNDRKEVIAIVDGKNMKKGDVLNPHVLMAEQMIKDGLVKAAPTKKEK